MIGSVQHSKHILYHIQKVLKTAENEQLRDSPFLPISTLGVLWFVLCSHYSTDLQSAEILKNVKTDYPPSNKRGEDFLGKNQLLGVF